jgi:methyl-accepting chemotaxis protein
MSNMKIGVRLGLGFGVVMTFMLLISGISLNRLHFIEKKIVYVTTDCWPKAKALSEIKDAVNLTARCMRNMILSDDPQEFAKEKKRILGAREVVVKNIDYLKNNAGSGTGKELVDKVAVQRGAYVISQNLVMELIDQKKNDEAKKELFTSVRKSQADYLAAIDAYVDFESKAMDTAGSTAADSVRLTRNVTLAMLALAFLLSGCAAVVVVRGITGPVATLLGANEKLASGDLTVEIDIRGRDEIGLLAESSRRVVANLRQLISQVSDNAHQVAASAGQLQSAAEQIAAGAEQVAEQTGTVATASEEMAATSGDIARNCVLAVQSSSESDQAAGQGVQVVQETISGMARIAERVQQSAATVESLGARSEQIGAIIGTINDIADQTNLLALNAAIEAARAGEQGRGFAVVADEVRALAQRTGQATKEIGEMIKNIQQETQSAVKAMEEGVAEVERGAASSGRSGEALETIKRQIGNMAMQINQIATAAEEQTATTSEISGNIQQVTFVVQSTAQSANETATAACQLTANAQQLQQLVGKFKLA